MKEGITRLTKKAVRSADDYFQRKDTLLARGLHRAVPLEGAEYADSWQKAAFERSAASVLLLYSLPGQVSLAAAIEVEGIKKEKKLVPVFYRATRIGKDGKEFKVWKYKTLKRGSDQKEKENIANNLRAGKGPDPRTTGAVSEWARNWKADESPQLAQVVFGQKMRLFGIRPPEPKQLKEIEENVPGGKEFSRKVKCFRTGLVNPVFVFGKDDGGHEEQVAIANRFSDEETLGGDLFIAWRLGVQHLLREDTDESEAI